MAYQILVVDDSKTMRDAIIKTLRISDVPIQELHEGENGREGLDILRENWIDLMFSDINMPVMDGIEMIDKMSEDDLLKTIPVVVISTVGNTKMIENLMVKGVRAYLRKPMTPESLREVIERVLQDGGKGDPANVLNKTFLEVLEKSAYLFAEEAATKAVAPPSEVLHHAFIRFKGEYTGHISLVMAHSTAVDLAANVLGVDVEEVEANGRAEDALKELLNITCGRFLTDLAGEQAEFEQAPPELEALREEAWVDMVSQERTAAFQVDEQPVLLSLALEEDV